jgi:hypothetical protein
MSIVTYNNRSIANISAIPGAAKSLTHIKTLTASGDSTLSFVNGSSDVVLDSTYPIYVFKFIGIHPSANNRALKFNMSTDTGSNYNVSKTTTAFYAYHNEAGNDQAVGYVTGEDHAEDTGFAFLSNGTGGDNDQAISGEMFLFNPSSTAFVKHYTSKAINYGPSDYAYEWRMAGYGNTESAVDAIQFKLSADNMDAGTIKMYGLKDS